MKERCFIIGNMGEYLWKMRMANMERRVNSKSFHGGVYEAVSPRVVLNGKECRLKRNLKLRRAMCECSAVYVLSNYKEDAFACRLLDVAVRKGKTVIVEGF